MTVTTEAAAELLYREAWCLDTKRWEGWLALYADDAVYWAPAMVGDEGWTDDPDNDVSLMYMDKAGLEARVFRIENREGKVLNGEKKEVFKFEDGIKAFVRHLNEGKETLHKEVIYISREDTEAMLSCEIAMQYNDADGLVEVSATWLVHSYLRVRGATTRGGLYEYGLRETPEGLCIARKKIFIHDDRIVGPLDIYNV